MAWTEQDYQEIKARLLAESQGVGDVPNAENLTGITSLPAYQDEEGQDIPKIVKAPLALLAAPALEAADKANAAAEDATIKGNAAQVAADNAYNSRTGVVYRRTNSTTVATPTGGSFDNPVPVETDWSTQIPEGLGKLWVSIRTFTSNERNQDAAWSTPVAMTYNMYTEYKTSTLQDNPGNPDDNPANWTDEFVEGYIWVATQLVYNGTKKGWVVVRAAGDTRQAVHNAEVATDAANVATASANQATINANRAADNADAKAELANTAAANAEDTATHPTYIGTDHYVYKWNKTTKAYDKTDIYCKGDAFSVKKVYASVAALNADVNNSAVKVGDFVLVNTNDVENPDNAKLYVKVKNGSTYAYDFLVDMSGAIGFTGKTPQFSMGTITTLEAGSTATATVSENGVDGNGNPRYKINFAIPRGNPGAPFRVAGQYTTFDALKAAVPNGASIDGFMAVGAKVPYNYYAWVGGEWKDQGQIAGGGGNIVNLPASLLNLPGSSTSAEILNVFGGADKFRELLKKLSETNCVIQIGTPGTSKHRVYTNVEYYIYYTETGQSDLNINIYTEGPEIKRFHLHLKADNTATCTEASTYQLIDNSKVVNNLTTNDSSKVLSAAQGKILNDNTIKINNLKFSKKLDLSALDSNTWYPCSIPISMMSNANRYDRICINADFSYNNTPWSTHINKRITLLADLVLIGKSTGWLNSSFSSLYNYSANYGGETAFGGITIDDNKYILIVYLRGGAKYYYYSFYGDYEFTVNKDGYTSTSLSAPLKSEQGNPFEGFRYAFTKDKIFTKNGAENVVESGDVLTKTNTTAYTPTANYHPATKKYVDDVCYGKRILINSVNYILDNKNLTGAEAETHIFYMFGNKTEYQKIVNDILTNHTRYFFYLYDNNQIEIGCVNAFKSSTVYELHFIVSYYTNHRIYFKRITTNINNNQSGSFIIIADIVTSDNLTTITKKTTTEYDAITNKDDYTMYAVVD